MIPIHTQSLDSIPAPFREHYVQIGGVYLLNLEDHPNPLYRAIFHEYRQRQEAEQRIDKTTKEIELERTAGAAAATAAVTADRDKLERELAAKFEKDSAELKLKLDDEVSSLRRDVHRLHLETAAAEIAGKLARTNCARILIPHIAARLSVVEENNTRRVAIRSAEGREIAVDALVAEFRARPEFAPVVTDGRAEKARHAQLVAEMIGGKRVH